MTRSEPEDSAIQRQFLHPSLQRLKMPGTWSKTIQAMNSDPSQVSQSHWWVKANLLTPPGCCPLTSSHSSSTMRFISCTAWNGHFFQNTNIQRLSECLNLNFAIKISAKKWNTLKIHCKKIKHMDMFFHSSREKTKKTHKLRDLAVRVGPSLWVFPSNLGEHMIPIKCWSQTCASWQVVEFEVIFRSVGVLLLFWAFWYLILNAEMSFLCGQKKYVFKFDCELYLW